MNLKPDGEERVLIPVVLKKGEWHPFYGGEMPKLTDGTIADIIVDRTAFLDSQELARFNLEYTVTILKA